MRQRTTAYGFARLDEGAMEVFARFVRGRDVVDIGAGRGALSTLALGLGASSVVAIDPRMEMHSEDRLTVITDYLQDASDIRAEHIILSWPTNSPAPAFAARVESMISKCTSVLYIGLNDQFTVCGWLGLWRALRKRRVVEAFPVGSENTLIHYGEMLSASRQEDLLIPEELRGIEAARFAA